MNPETGNYFELDLWLPSLNLAFEYQVLPLHSLPLLFLYIILIQNRKNIITQIRTSLDPQMIFLSAIKLKRSLLVPKASLLLWFLVGGTLQKKGKR